MAKVKHISSIKDLAKHLGTSTATISRAINGQPGVGYDLRQKVLKVAAEWDYYPNSIARNFSRARTDTIGVSVPRLRESVFVNNYYMEVLAGIDEVLSRNNYNIHLFTTSAAAEKRSLVRYFKEKRVDGLIVLGLSLEELAFCELEKSEAPYVTLGRGRHTQKGSLVEIDHMRSFYAMTEHLITVHGKRKIYLIAGLTPHKFVHLSNQISGYRQAMSDHGLVVEEGWVQEAYSDPDSGSSAIKELIDRNGVPDAVMTASDYTAIGVLAAAKEAGFVVPDDFAVTGNADYEAIAHRAEPPLTTIRQDNYEMGRLGARIVLDAITGVSSGPQQVMLQVKPVIRQSCGCP